MAPEPSDPSRMAFWKKILGSEDAQPVDYYTEGIELLEDGKFHEALTSFRLALKESPGDVIVLQQIAICYTRIGLVSEAAKTYRHVLQKAPNSAGSTRRRRSISRAETARRISSRVISGSTRCSSTVRAERKARS